MTVSDLEVKCTLLWEFSGSLAKAYDYAIRISATSGPLQEQYKRVAEMLHRDADRIIEIWS